ncbi:hypothetical protein [Nonomuraea turkmeniaca]|uniref:hypothetical protein n=1 Tax=Nonomuraea turkmeniaca TaxID=103838 RepID=UPI00147732FB|nr:hypothetical protein [Nonomuraea turkmeniaca]
MMILSKERANDQLPGVRPGSMESARRDEVRRRRGEDKGALHTHHRNIQPQVKEIFMKTPSIGK